MIERPQLYPGKACLLAACLMSVPALQADGQLRPGDDLLVVDCLLPPQVRQLGRRTTYLSARKAVRTTARDCQIRGGEYVTYDRASLRSSLKVWLPLAESGDAEAQTIVGEIYEKGIGEQPDHAMAARWYRMAAAQKDVRAQISLGYLLENGLGMEPDPVAAANWYRRAAGSDQVVELDPEVFRIDDLDQHEDSAEMVALRDKLRTLIVEAEQMRAQLETTRASLETERTQLQMAESELADLHSETQVQAREDPVAQVPAQGPVAVSSSLLVLRNDLEKRNREMADLGALLAETRTELTARTGDLAAREAQIAGYATALERAEAQRQELRQLEQSVAASEAEIKSQRQKIQVLKSSLATSSSDAALGADELLALQAVLAESEANAATQRNQVAQLQTRLAESESGAASRELDLARVEEELTEREFELATERDNAVHLQAELGRLGTEARRLQGELAQRNSAKAIKERVLVGPTIAMIEPEFAGARGIAVVSSVQSVIISAAPNVRTRQIIGRVTAPAGLLSLTVNDASLRPNPAGVFAADIALDNLPKTVSVVAVDQQGKRENVAFELRSTAITAQGADENSYEQDLRSIEFGNYYALIIGNNAYGGLPDLQTAVDDARDLERVLSQMYGFQTRLLLNASRYEILSALNDLREQLTTDDNLVIFYAGHGELDRINMRGHWLPVDAEPGSSANWLSNVAITDILNVMNARQILVIADSCYSGALTRSSIARLKGGMTEAERLNWLRTMAQKRSRMVLSSGGLSPVLDAGGGSHSVFTRALLQVLESNQELIEGQRLYQEVAARVAYQAANMQFDQVPEYAPIRFAGHESGDFFFVPAL